MKTSDLIDLLARDDRPVRQAGLLQLPLALAASFLVALALTALILGVRSWPVLASIPVLGKLVFTFGMAALTLPALLRALHPGSVLGYRHLLPLIAASGVIGAAILQIQLDPATRVWRPDTPYCLVLIPLFGLPGLLLLARAARAQAPTDLRWAGLLTGLVAGGLSATAYALHCPNDDPVYLAAWYLPAVIITGLVGRALGARILAW